MPRRVRTIRPRRRRLLKKRMMRRKAPIGRSLVPRKSDYARLVETVEVPLLSRQEANAESTGQTFTFSLAGYQRAMEVAHAYKYYRAAKVQMKFVPYYNIAQTNGAAPSRLPQLYFSVDRVANQFILPTETELLSRGISPKLFTRSLNYSWKPNLLQDINLETVQAADPGGAPLGIGVLGSLNRIALFNKWIPTQQSYGYTGVIGNAQIGQQIVPGSINPYALKYYGAVWVASVEGVEGQTLTVGDLQIKITWEFKEPRALKTNAPLPEANPHAGTSMSVPGVVANSQPTTYP